jgi:hypothetical protein
MVFEIPQGVRGMKRAINLLNVALFGMVCYVYGNYQGLQEQKSVDNQMAIRYAVLQALNEVEQ